VIEVSQQATETARQILSLRERHRQVITDHFGRAAGNGHRVLEHLYRHPIVSVTDVRTLIQKTYPAANNLVAQFMAHGVLHEMTGQRRNRKFVYREYVNLFYDDTQPSTSL
jgi:hypothetical protein